MSNLCGLKAAMTGEKIKIGGRKMLKMPLLHGTSLAWNRRGCAGGAGPAIGVLQPVGELFVSRMLQRSP